MTQGYRTIQDWSHWLSQQFLGSRLLEAEQQRLTTLLSEHYGKHALLIGVPEQRPLLQASTIMHQWLLTPLLQAESSKKIIEGDWYELPFLSGSMDLVLLPHTLQFVDNPRQLLAEACRVIKPEGLILITGFNPYGLWLIRQHLIKKKAMPWNGNFMTANTIKKWLHLAEFHLEEQDTILFRPPLEQHPAVYQKLQFLERVGKKCYPALGGAYVLKARAKQIPWTPIRWRWKQKISSLPISTTISGHIARQMK